MAYNARLWGGKCLVKISDEGAQPSFLHPFHKPFVMRLLPTAVADKATLNI